MNRARGGNIPGLPSPEQTTDPARRKDYSFVANLEAGIAEPKRDTQRNRFLARRNGWTESEYLHWVDTGDIPTRSVVASTPASRPNEIDDDERLHQ